MWVPSMAPITPGNLLAVSKPRIILIARSPLGHWINRFDLKNRAPVTLRTALIAVALPALNLSLIDL